VAWRWRATKTISGAATRGHDGACEGTKAGKATKKQAAWRGAGGRRDVSLAICSTVGVWRAGARQKRLALTALAPPQRSYRAWRNVVLPREKQRRWRRLSKAEGAGGKAVRTANGKTEKRTVRPLAWRKRLRYAAAHCRRNYSRKTAMRVAFATARDVKNQRYAGAAENRAAVPLAFYRTPLMDIDLPGDAIATSLFLLFVPSNGLGW